MNSLLVKHQLCQRIKTRINIKITLIFLSIVILVAYASIYLEILFDPVATTVTAAKLKEVANVNILTDKNDILSQHNSYLKSGGFVCSNVQNFGPSFRNMNEDSNAIIFDYRPQNPQLKISVGTDSNIFHQINWRFQYITQKLNDIYQLNKRTNFTKYRIEYIIILHGLPNETSVSGHKWISPLLSVYPQSRIAQLNHRYRLLQKDQKNENNDDDEQENEKRSKMNLHYQSINFWKSMKIFNIFDTLDNVLLYINNVTNTNTTTQELKIDRHCFYPSQKKWTLSRSDNIADPFEMLDMHISFDPKHNKRSMSLNYLVHVYKKEYNLQLFKNKTYFDKLELNNKNKVLNVLFVQRSQNYGRVLIDYQTRNELYSSIYTKIENLQGFKTQLIHLENMTSINQSRYFSNADIVLAAHGAGLTNLIFMSQWFPHSRMPKMYPNVCNNESMQIIKQENDLRAMLPIVIEISFRLGWCYPQPYSISQNMTNEKLLYRMNNNCTEKQRHFFKADYFGLSRKIGHVNFFEVMAVEYGNERGIHPLSKEYLYVNSTLILDIFKRIKQQMFLSND